MHNTGKGFTLIEIMITVAIVAILASIAYPGYVSQVRKTRRSDATAALLKTAQVLERCYTEYNAYNDTSCPAVDDSDDTKLADGSGSQSDYTSTESGYYTISATTLSATSFTLSATPTPTSDQANDKCGNFTYDHVGRKGVSADVDGDGTAGDADDVKACW